LSALPTIAVGRISVSQSMGETGAIATTDPAPAAALIRDGETDLIAVGRSLLANPDWCDIVRAGKWHDLKAFDKRMLKTLD
jgi:2,4-dienoyl-CoA reductase-like NADH-dependent reductase (Old Yellow Enzyme family)